MTTYKNSPTTHHEHHFKHSKFLKYPDSSDPQGGLDASQAKVLRPSLRMKQLGSGCKVFCGCVSRIPPGPPQRPMADAGKPRGSPGFLSLSLHPNLELSLKCAGPPRWHTSSNSKFLTSQLPGKSAVYRATQCAEAPRRLEAILTSDQLLLRVSQSEKYREDSCLLSGVISK